MLEQNIQLLDEQTINQIAAGEVIENSASVVKELVENAIDSGATHVTVETKGGGRGLIRIVDDGCGMSGDNLLLSLERHATSKLHNIEDLNSLGTLGFRGEALSSIASVSKLSIHTAVDEGRQLLSEGGKILKVAPLPRQQGTTIEVKSLFYNVPARRKFQKSVGWDTAEIHKVLTKMALCHQHVGFTWISDDVKQFTITPEASLHERVCALLGDAFGAAMLHVEHHQKPYTISGLCSQPAFHRPNRTGQYLFMNGRPVVSPFVARKVLEGYGTRLSMHRYPLFVLHLTLPPELIDVNVHPQKKEVRLRDESALGPFITEAIERAFAPKQERSAPVVMPDFVAAEPIASYTPTFLDEREEQMPSLIAPHRRLVAKVGDYLLCEDGEGMCVVDGAAARMRVAFEQLSQKGGQQEIQHLLIPIQIEVTGAEKRLLMDNLEQFEDVGISIRHFGENTFVIDAIPALFESEEVVPFVHAFLGEGDLPKERRLARALGKMVEMRGAEEALVQQLFRCAEPSETPDGRPTFKRLTEKGLGQLFR